MPNQESAERVVVCPFQDVHSGEESAGTYACDSFRLYLTKEDYRAIFPDLDSFSGDILQRIYLWYVNNKVPFDPSSVHRPFLVFLGLAKRYPHKTLDGMLTTRSYNDLIKRWYGDEPSRWEDYSSRPLIHGEELERLHIKSTIDNRHGTIKIDHSKYNRKEFSEKEKVRLYNATTMQQVWQDAMWNKIQGQHKSRTGKRY